MANKDQNFKSRLASAGQTDCSICGHSNSLDSRQCQSCGHPLDTSNTEQFPNLRSEQTEDDTIMVIKNRSGPKRYRLVMLSDNGDDQQSFEIKEDSIIGRSQGDILISNGHISRRHCAFSIRNDRLYLSDLNSTNGVFLKVRDSAQIDPPAELLMGSTVFRVVRKS